MCLLTRVSIDRFKEKKKKCVRLDVVVRCNVIRNVNRKADIHGWKAERRDQCTSVSTIEERLKNNRDMTGRTLYFFVVVDSRTGFHCVRTYMRVNSINFPFADPQTET